MKWFSFVVIAIVVASVIGGLVLVGSPREARARAADNIRTSQLSILQYDIAEFWRQEKTLPENLALLRPIEGEAGLPKDPTTGAQFGYSVVNTSTFRLCATFETESISEESMYYPRMGTEFSGPFIGNEQEWKHGVGETCFERRINDAYYRELEKNVSVTTAEVAEKSARIIAQ